MENLLFASDNKESLKALTKTVGENYRIDTAHTRTDCFKKIKKERYDVVFIETSFLSSGDGNFRSTLKEMANLMQLDRLVALAPAGKTRDAVNAVLAGAGNYLTHPLNPEETKLVIAGLKESRIMKVELDYLRDAFWKTGDLEMVRTNSEKMKKVFDKVRSVAETRTTVLLTGETGVGKGIVARLIHLHSSRRKNQFVSVHCGAIPETLVESELFGHEKGAFTGADKRRLGKFEVAEGGTIFLDEVGTVTPSAQIKLLQVLQDRLLQRVGGETAVESDVRIIAATNENLKELCDKGVFRKDLFYRLSVFPIEIPPLRERKEDIPQLIAHFILNLNRNNLKDIQGVDPKVLTALMQYQWPGNIRELENLIERAHILESGNILTPDSFPSELFSDISSGGLEPAPPLPLSKAREKAVTTAEQHYLSALLQRNFGKINLSAKEAGITTRQLHKLLAKHGIKKELYKK